MLSYLGNRLFTFSPEDVDNFLPQLIVLYVHNATIAEAINPYLVSRCRTSVYTSLHIIWLLNAFCPDIPSTSYHSNHVRKPKSHGHRLRNLILSEELRSQRKEKVNGVHQNKRIQAITDEDDNMINRMTAIDGVISSTSHHRTHFRSLSDATCISSTNTNSNNVKSSVTKCIHHNQHNWNCSNHRTGQPFLRMPTFHLSPHRRSSTASLEKPSLGDLSSGHAFDNGCVCFLDQTRSNCVICGTVSTLPTSNNSNNYLVECCCGAPRIKPQYEFIRCLMNIGLCKIVNVVRIVKIIR